MSERTLVAGGMALQLADLHLQIAMPQNERQVYA